MATGYLTPYPPKRGVITLSDGTLYPTTSITVEPGVWYAVAHFFRFWITGTGTVSVDGRDLLGNITGNIESKYGETDGVSWYPEMGSNNAFRLNVVTGNPKVTYLP